MDNVVTRMAPSPTGSLHLGGLRTALFSYAYAKKHNGKFLLRIEDTDQNRFVPGSDEEILQMLREFGLNWDNSVVQYQSKTPLKYLIKAQELICNHIAYKCWCPINSDVDCKCFENQNLLPANTPYCIKLRIPENMTIKCNDRLRGEILFNSQELYDIILIKQDRLPTYHLASVVDDISTGVTHVFRGEEWLPSLPYHILLYSAFEKEPPKFYHLPLILDPGTNCKLSKRNNNASVKDYLKLGVPKEAILNYVATLGYTTDKEFFTLEDFIYTFSVDRISTHSACFDLDKMNFYSRSYLDLLSNEQILSVFNNPIHSQQIYSRVETPSMIHAISMFRSGIKNLSELSEKIETLFNDCYISTLSLTIKEQSIIGSFCDFLFMLQRIPSADEIQEFIRNSELSNKEFHPVIRKALTGAETGYQIHDIISILGLDITTDRLWNLS